ncbi:MAG: magnesium protoporphyrin IX methyltransferase [Betaproteobacteria bacterium]|nr:magnesium protoporphyrin IX methyltransferase [Betaproteobacteria bacterium]
MEQASYQQRRNEVEQYFDRTAFSAWARLTSDAPVSRIRATVRAGRERMRANMLHALGADLTGRRILDAGCGTGAMAIELAQRGADVLAVDLSGQLIELAKERATLVPGKGRILWVAGDMLDAGFGQFDHVVAMDSLIHYEAVDMVPALEQLAQRSTQSLHVSFAPSTAMLALMHAVGRCLPRADRAPSSAFEHCKLWLGERVNSGFYISQLLNIEQAPLRAAPVPGSTSVPGSAPVPGSTTVKSEGGEARHA